jgi:hypothetical protein
VEEAAALGAVVVAGSERALGRAEGSLIIHFQSCFTNGLGTMARFGRHFRKKWTKRGDFDQGDQMSL